MTSPQRPGRPGSGPIRSAVDDDRPSHPMGASLVLVIGVVLLIVLLSVGSVYF